MFHRQTGTVRASMLRSVLRFRLERVMFHRQTGTVRASMSRSLLRFRPEGVMRGRLTDTGIWLRVCSELSSVSAGGGDVPSTRGHPSGR